MTTVIKGKCRATMFVFMLCKTCPLYSPIDLAFSAIDFDLGSSQMNGNAGIFFLGLSLASITIRIYLDC